MFHQFHFHHKKHLPNKLKCNKCPFEYQGNRHLDGDEIEDSTPQPKVRALGQTVGY
jgi:hypothetical protein